MSRIAYPSIPREKDRRKDVSAITQTVEVLTGAKGDGLDRALTPRDMAEGGFANISYRTVGGRALVDLTPVSSDATADKPTVTLGFSANAAFANVVLSWDRALFKGYAYTEIWRATSDDFGAASRIATSIPNIAADPVSIGATYYYWIRFVNILGETGPLNATAGTPASVGLIGNSDLSDLIITAGKIADSSVIASKIANLAVGNAAIQNAAITNVKIANLAVDNGHIANINAGKINAGTLNTSRLNIDGSTLISDNGVLKLGNVQADSITGGTLDFQNVTAQNLTVANLSGDVSKFFPFSMASAANLGQGQTTIWAGQIPASEAAGIGRAPYLIASGWGVFQNDDTCRVSLHMRINQAYSDYTLGTIVAAETIFFGDFPYDFFVYYYIEVSGDHTAFTRGGGDLSVSNVVKGTITSASYIASTGRTRIFYTVVSGTLAVGNTVVADGGPASMDMVAHNFFRADYDYHAKDFSICGGLDVESTVSVDAEIRIGIYNNNYKGIPSSVPNDNWDGDQVFGLEGIMIGAR